MRTLGSSNLGYTEKAAGVAGVCAAGVLGVVLQVWQMCCCRYGRCVCAAGVAGVYAAGVAGVCAAGVAGAAGVWAAGAAGVYMAGAARQVQEGVH